MLLQGSKYEGIGKMFDIEALTDICVVAVWFMLGFTASDNKSLVVW